MNSRKAYTHSHFNNKNQLLKCKCADLTANQLITIIILIVSFAVILIFFFMLNLKGMTDTEVCRNSIVMRDIPLGSLTVNFKCKTQNVLIEETEPEKIYKELAELQSDCFWMMGEGKIDIGNGNCAICNVVEFGDDVKDFSWENYYKYLESHDVSGKDISYLFYMYGVQKFESSMQNVSKFDSNKKYMIYFSYKEISEILGLKVQNPFGNVNKGIGILPYDSETIAKLECDEFVTTS